MANPFTRLEEDFDAKVTRRLSDDQICLLMQIRDRSLLASWAVFLRAHTGDNDLSLLFDTFDVKVDSTN